MGSFRLAVQQISRIFNMSLFNKIILVFILGCCLGQEEEPETSALFKNIKIPLPLVNINIKKPRVTKTFSVPVIRKNVNTINRSKNPQLITHIQNHTLPQVQILYPKDTLHLFTM